MLHYNFPPYSTGEVKPLRGTSRREIGHGALAERALQPLLPALRGLPLHPARGLGDPRVQRLLLDGHRLRRLAGADGCRRADKAACAGVAMGLIKEGEQVAILTDILGSEDHLGDMDFKVAGTEQGITVDSDGHQDRGTRPQDHGRGTGEGPEGRLHILSEMSKALPAAAARAFQVCAPRSSPC